MTNSIPLIAVLALMLAAAVMTVITDRLVTAVIFAGSLSAFAAFGYVLLGAPDVALAEVVVGATLATIIFLVTLKKYRIFSVYFTGGSAEDAEQATAIISRALRSHDLEPHFIRTNEPAAVLLSRAGCDLVAELSGGRTIILHREESSQYSREMIDALRENGFVVTLEDSLTQSAVNYREGRT